MNNVRHVKSPLTDEKTTGQLWPRLNLSTGCSPCLSVCLSIRSNCLPACHTVSLPLWHSAAAAASSCPSIILYLHWGYVVLALPACPPASPLGTHILQWLHFMCRFLLRGCSLQFRELSELIGWWFERAALTTPPAFSFGLKLSTPTPAPKPFRLLFVDKRRFSGHSSSSLNSSLIFSWLLWATVIMPYSRLGELYRLGVLDHVSYCIPETISIALLSYNLT